MFHKVTVASLVASLFFCAFSSAWALNPDNPQFRGPNRDGIYPATNLLKSWPAEGPKLRWSATGLGLGFSSTAVADGLAFTTGQLEEREFVFAFDTTGKEVWRHVVGDAHSGGGFPGARSTPTVHEGMVYVISGKGRVVCFDAKKGTEVWAVDTLNVFAKGKAEDEVIPKWAISESVLIDGDKLICTPGAPEASVVALDRKTGKTLWTSKGLSEVSGYCNARIYEQGKIRQIITLTGKSMVGLDPQTGQLIWQQEYPGSWDIHANSPLFMGNILYVSDGYGSGGTAFEIAADGKSVKELWKEKTLDIQIGGGVLLDGKIFGASNRGKWIGLDAKTGKVVAEGKGTGKGVVVYADGLLYGYGEKGIVGIVDPKSTSLETISQFKLSAGSGQHWAHPTISKDALYIRHGDTLLCYDIKAK